MAILTLEQKNESLIESYRVAILVKKWTLKTRHAPG